MMKSSITLQLGKVMTAIAWADGAIQVEEVNCLKDLLFHLPVLTQEELVSLYQFFEKPVGKMERGILIDDLLHMLSTPEEKDFALYALERIVVADGVVHPKELRMLETLKEALLHVDTGLAHTLKGLLKAALSLRLNRVSKWLQNSKLENYLQAKMAQLEEEKLLLGFEAVQLRKLLLTGGLMGYLMWGDHRILDEEAKGAIQYFQVGWDLTLQEAGRVTQILLDPNAANLDMLRLSREYYEVTTLDERLNLFEALIKIGLADGPLVDNETTKLIQLATYLKLERGQLQTLLSRCAEEQSSF